MTKLFCEKSYIEYGGETIPRPKQVVFATWPKCQDICQDMWKHSFKS